LKLVRVCLRSNIPNIGVRVDYTCGRDADEGVSINTACSGLASGTYDECGKLPTFEFNLQERNVQGTICNYRPRFRIQLVQIILRCCDVNILDPMIPGINKWSCEDLFSSKTLKTPW
jgi:hypothetical protein